MYRARRVGEKDRPGSREREDEQRAAPERPA